MNLSRLPLHTVRRAQRDERGQILVLAVGLIAVFLGMAALSIDLGFFMHERQNVQNAVDSGALAGAQMLPDNATAAATVALQFTLANDPGLNASKVNVSFRCQIGRASCRERV